MVTPILHTVRDAAAIEVFASCSEELAIGITTCVACCSHGQLGRNRMWRESSVALADEEDPKRREEGGGGVDYEIQLASQSLDCSSSLGREGSQRDRKT